MGGDTDQWVPDPLTDRELVILQFISDRMSDREIAQRLYLSLNTVKWHNRQIYSKLDVSDRKQAVARASDLGLFDAGPETLPDAAVVPKHNLPAPVTSFVGRERQVAEVHSLLAASTRLLTLCGPPGTGKTRLALRMAAEVLDEFEDGVFFVDLSPISDPQLVATTIGQVLGVREEGVTTIVEGLQNVLRAKHLLLLLDNFEQIIEAAPLVTDLLSAAPGLKVLVTSREILHVGGEQIYRVPPLALPDLNHVEALDTLAAYEAVDLFLQRARSVKHDFALNAENAHAVAETCNRLDGLPLALELAATWTRVLTPEEIGDEIAQDLDFLATTMRDMPERHRSMRATLNHSWRMLSNSEQDALMKLSVFRGGFTQEAAKAVAGVSLMTLVSLVDRSMLQRVPGGRYTTHEMVRQFGAEKLTDTGNDEAVHHCHSHFYVELATELYDDVYESQSKRLIEAWTIIEAEYSNFRAALGWVFSKDDAERACRLVYNLALYWWQSGQFVEGQTWYNQALEQRSRTTRATQAEILLHTSFLYSFSDFAAKRQQWSAELLAISRELGDQLLIARALLRTAAACSFLGKYEEAEGHYKEAVSCFREINDPMGIITGLNNLGELMQKKGDYLQAVDLYYQALRVCREVECSFSYNLVNLNLAHTWIWLGKVDEAIPVLQDCLRRAHRLTQPGITAVALAAIAEVAIKKCRLTDAVRLLGAVQSMLDNHQTTLDMADLDAYESSTIRVRRELDEDTFETCWEEGCDLPVEEAVELALSLGKGDG
jgi:predicted ATPase/DNA-binding CsgD family transcriptional regulator